MSVSKKLFTRKGNTFHLVHAKHARTMSQRFMGLMGVSPNAFDYGLVFHLAEEGRMNASIHMLFMRMPIDLLFLDSQRRVVDMVKNLQPWTLNYTPKKDAEFVIELPAGTIKKFAIPASAKLNWEE